MLQPKRVKYRKVQKSAKLKGVSVRGSKIEFGTYGIKALEPSWITSNQIEAVRVAITKAMKREGKLWIRIFPDKPLTKKPAEVRMGKGKGAPESWVAVVRPGRVLFELDGVEDKVAREAFRLAGHKLPIKVRMLERSDF